MYPFLPITICLVKSILHSHPITFTNFNHPHLWNYYCHKYWFHLVTNSHHPKNPHLYILGGTTICSRVCCTLLLLSSLLLRTPSSICNSSHWSPHTFQLLYSILHCWSTCSCLLLRILTQTLILIFWVV